MSQSRSEGSHIWFYLVGGVSVVLVLAIVGGILFLSWERLGLPTPEKFVEEVQADHTGEVPGAIVIEGNAANYHSYVNRDDLFVVVNFYPRRDDLTDELLLDLKQLSARHEGRVMILNVDARLQPRLGVAKGGSHRRDVRLMHNGQELGSFHSERLAWQIEEIVERDEGSLADPILQAAAADPEVEVDPYAESVRKQRGAELPGGVEAVK